MCKLCLIVFLAAVASILQAKGLRTALCVRVVHTRVQAGTVIYVLRVEDVETGLQWVVHRRYRDFAALNDELSDLSHFTKDIAFPRKHLASSRSPRIVEERIVALEQFARRVLHVLTLYATMDPLASRSLRHLQSFLGVDRYIDCVHPPLVDDQRCIELLAYRILSDFSSPACQQCIRFVSAVDLNALVQDGPDGYKPMLRHLSLALAEVEAFVLEHHLPQMLQTISGRRPGYSSEQCRVFVRRCVRRQVEAAIFLPLRRNVFRIVYSFVAVQAQCMQRAMGLLQQAAPDYFEVDAFILQTQAMPRAIKSFRDVIQAYLPADQGQLLMHAAAAVMQLHGECTHGARALKKAKSIGSSAATTPVRSLQSPPAAAEALRPRLSSGGTPDGSRHSTSRFSGARLSLHNQNEARLSVAAAVPSHGPPAAATGAGVGGATSASATAAATAPTSGTITVASAAAATSGKVSPILAGGRPAMALQGAGAGSSRAVTSGTAGPNSPRDFDFTSKAAMADPVGSMFHSHETRPDAVLLSRRKSTNGETDGGGDNPGKNSVESSFSPSAAAFLPSSDNGGSASQAVNRGEEPAEADGDGEDLALAADSAMDTLEERENSAKAAQLQEKLRALALVPLTPVGSSSSEFGQPGSAPRSVGAGSAAANLFPEDSAQMPQELIAAAAAPQMQAQEQPLPPQPPLSRQPTAESAGIAEAASAASSSDSGPATTYAYFTAEEKLLLDEVMGDREYVSEEAQMAAASAAQQAVNVGKTPDKFGASDAKMQATTTKGFFEVLPGCSCGCCTAPMLTYPTYRLLLCVFVSGVCVMSQESAAHAEVVSADDFLPMFTFVLVQASLPQLLLVKEIMTALVADEETFGECGYYLATLEAATQHIVSLAEQFEDIDKADQLFGSEMLTPNEDGDELY